jgi:endonuclease/exonuclease/phosphatase family metal-dependent hydrolase
MPFYRDLKPSQDQAATRQTQTARRRTIAHLLGLRKALNTDAGAPPPRGFGTLLLATWNLREFDLATWGLRLPESYAYMAEIIDRFDLVAVQEVREDLAALGELLRRLGPSWDYIASDVTEGKAGNRERLAFLYDKRKVRFLGIAGELVLPPVTAGKDVRPATQIARTPLMAAFQVGWTKFVLTTVHILYGSSSREPVARVEEIRQVARFLRERADAAIDHTGNMLLLGDFNIFAKGDKTYAALVDEGFTIPDEIDTIPGSNVSKNKKYDQIAYRARPARFEATGRAGVFDFFEYVFTDAESNVYRSSINAYIKQRQAEKKTSPKPPKDQAAATTQYRTWRTYQMSDHLPLWAEFRVDFSEDYLNEIAEL